MLSRQMTKVIDSIKTAFDSGKSLFSNLIPWVYQSPPTEMEDTGLYRSWKTCKVMEI